MRPFLTVGVFVLCVCTNGLASGHGPVFGLATPTNGRGQWVFDFGLMGRVGSEDSGSMARFMASYGITQDFQLSLSAPVIFTSAPLAPGRVTGMMAASGDVEALAGWRFHRRAPDVGTRFESTVFGGLVAPGPQRGEGIVAMLKRAPGVYTAAATGMASLSHYVWGGAGYKAFAEDGGDRRPPLLFYSAVWGYRPPAWRTELPHADWRIFVELTGERSGHVRHGGVRMAETGGHQVFLGPSVLGILREVAIEGGIQFPIHRDVGALHQRERFRFAVNVTYFLGAR